MSDVSGFLNLNKPTGSSSFSFVSRLRRLTGVRRIGHGGTLDPAASGVLPICIGQATRMSDLLLTARKQYAARVRLGVITNTYDADGAVVEERDPSGVTLEQVREALRPFVGRVRQVPPMYSALKREGKPLYELAREGIEVDREPREVEIYRVEVTGWAPPCVDLDVECGRGTYIRSLAHDLGLALGCGASLAALTRTRVGPFRLEDAVTVEDIQRAAEGGYWESYLDPPDLVATDLPAAILDEDGSRSVQEGRFLPQDQAQRGDSQLCRAYNQAGDFFAMLAYDPLRDGWQPSKVFLRGPAPAAPGPEGQNPGPGEGAATV